MRENGGGALCSLLSYDAPPPMLHLKKKKVGIALLQDEKKSLNLYIYEAFANSIGSISIHSTEQCTRYSYSGIVSVSWLHHKRRRRSNVPRRRRRRIVNRAASNPHQTHASSLRQLAAQCIIVYRNRERGRESLCDNVN